MPKKYFAVAILFAAILSQSLFAQITIRGTAKDENPTLYIRPIPSNPKVYNTLSRIFKFSDWFAVTSSTKAEYQAQLVQLSQNSATIALRDNAGGSVRITHQQAEADRDLALRRLVDKVITRIFKVPGLCASKVAFVNDHNGHKEIYTAYPDELYRAKQITRNRFISTEPVWGATTNDLFYTLYDKDSTNIVRINLGAKKHGRISSFKGLNANPAISPDGSKSAQVLSKDGRVELYYMDLKSRRPVRLTSNFYEEGTPTWSPDSTSVCYISNARRGVANLYLVDTRQPGRERLLVQSQYECVSPDWSPVSNKIAFAIRKGGTYKIATLDMNTKKYEVVTDLVGEWESPTWAPDGRHIICTRRTGGKSLLVMLDTRNGRVIPIQHPGTRGNTTLPDWSPLK